MDKKKCFQWLVNSVGHFQPECSKEKCMWWRKCNLAKIEVELPDEVMDKFFGVEKS